MNEKIHDLKNLTDEFVTEENCKYVIKLPTQKPKQSNTEDNNPMFKPTIYAYMGMSCLFILAIPFLFIIIRKQRKKGTRITFQDIENTKKKEANHLLHLNRIKRLRYKTPSKDEFHTVPLHEKSVEIECLTCENK